MLILGVLAWIISGLLYGIYFSDLDEAVKHFRWFSMGFWPIILIFAFFTGQTFNL